VTATATWVFLETETEGGTTTGETEATTEAHHKNNFFYGDINEVIWGSIAFLIVLGVFLWKGLPAVKRVMKKQQDTIATRITSAEDTHKQSEADLAALKASLGNVDQETARIVADARERAEILRVDLKTRAEVEIREALQRARIEIEASKAQALADLREEVVAMTVRATEAILEETLDDSVKASLVDRFIDQVGATS
jgi:F-type H+-transporting ATPase subunit b